MAGSDKAKNKIPDTKIIKSKFILALAAGIIGLAASANAAFVNYYATWSGGSFGNSSSAYASFKLDTDYLSTNNNVFNYTGGIPSWISDIDLTVTGASTGNGNFTSPDFYGAVYLIDGPVDFSQDLVGQVNFSDFNLFGSYYYFSAEGSPFSDAPNGFEPKVLSVSLPGGGFGENMQLTSLSISAVPEPSSHLALLALGSARLACSPAAG